MEVSAISSSQNAKQTSTPVVESVTAPKTDVMRKEKFELSISDQAIRSSIEKANKALEGMDRRFEYSVHEKTGAVVVKVINKQTDEVVREIPNEKLLDLMDKLQELAGLNIDEKR